MQSSPRHRILCVDDDEDACEMLGVLLGYANCHTTCAKSAEEAWDLISVGTFDLYLLDSWLPGANGFDLCRHIRAVDQQTPIVFYSAAAFDADKQRGMDAGANAYVTKPTIDVLLQTILNLLNRPETALASGQADWKTNNSATQFGFGREEDSLNDSVVALEL